MKKENRQLMMDIKYPGESLSQVIHPDAFAWLARKANEWRNIAR